MDEIYSDERHALLTTGNLLRSRDSKLLLEVQLMKFLVKRQTFLM